jgi:hypothetical protein
MVSHPHCLEYTGPVDWHVILTWCEDQFEGEWQPYTETSIVEGRYMRRMLLLLHEMDAFKFMVAWGGHSSSDLTEFPKWRPVLSPTILGR